MKKLADISSFEGLQRQAHAGFVSDISVFNSMETAKQFFDSEPWIINSLRRDIDKIAKGADQNEVLYKDETYTYAALELCNWIEEGYDITSDDLWKCLIDEVGEDVVGMLGPDEEGYGDYSFKWLKDNIADRLMDVAAQEHEYRLDEGEYVEEEGFTPVFK